MQKTTAERKYVEVLNERSASSLLILLLCGDLVFVVLYSIDRMMPGPNNPMLSIQVDRSYPEVYQYIKFFWTVLVFIYISFKNRSLPYAAWALIVTYFLLDDSMQIHEKVGARIAENLNFMPPFALRLQDLGELAFTAAAGVILLLLVIWAYKSGAQTFRKVSQDIIPLILVLVFFALVVDMVHSAINLGKGASFILTVIEDGGEMLSASLLLWYTFLLQVRGDNIGGQLCDLLRIVLTGRRT